MMKRRYSIGTLTTVARQIVIAPPNKTITIDSIYVMNYSSGNSTFDLFHVPAGESVADHFHLMHIVAIRPRRSTEPSRDFVRCCVLLYG